MVKNWRKNLREWFAENYQKILIGFCVAIGIAIPFATVGIVNWVNLRPKPKPVYEYVWVCSDQMASHSDGRGTCSHHGGELKWENLCVKYCGADDEQAKFYN